MTRGQRIAVRIGIALGSLLLVLMLGLLVLTRTDLGREQVRAFTVNQLNEALGGEVEIGRIEGNLLRRWRLLDLSIVDLEGRPFVEADTMATGFSIPGLLRRRIVLRDVVLVQAMVVLDRPPGEEWNFARILPEPDPDPMRLGWGDWIRLTDVTIIDSRLTVRSEWKPDPELPPADQERKIAEALDPENRANIQRVEGGFQNVMDFRRVSARLDEAMLADPDKERALIDVAALRAIAQPFRPPVADVRALEGRFYISGDSIWFPEVRARLPGSRLAGSGVYHMESADLSVRMTGAPAAFPDLHWLYPRLPEEGGGQIRLSVHRTQAATRILAEDMDVRVGDGELAGDLRLVVGDTFRILPTDLRFASLDTPPVERVIPRFEMPVHGTLDGRAALRGTEAAMQVDADVVLTHVPTGRSRVVASGGLGMGEQVRFSNLDLAFRPLRTDLVRGQVPRLPAGAIITGRATLDGVLGDALRLDADLALDDPATGRSRVLAAGLIDPEPGGVRFSGFDLGFQPLRAALVRDELPELPPRSAIVGQLRLDGSTTSILDVNGDLRIADPATGESRIAGAGAVDLAGDLAFRGLELRFDPLQVPLLQRLEPDLPLGGTLTGTATLEGRPGTRLAVQGDLVHREAGERSRVVGHAEVVPGAWARVDVQLRPLSLAIAGRFVPEAGLHGEVHGLLQAAGSVGDLSIRADLTVPRGGEILAEGHLDLESPRPGYDLAARVRSFNLAAVTARAPAATDLTGAIHASGRGLDPATMRAELQADLVGSAVDGLGADEVRLRMGIAHGLARVDSSIVRIGSTVAWADGEFGLVDWRHGELRYSVELSQLESVAPFLPAPAPDTGVVELRPALREEVLAEARAAVERAERRRLVEAIATGRAPPPEEVPAALSVDTLLLAGIPRDTVAGRLDAEGVLRGNIHVFDVIGTAEAEQLVFGGHYIGRGEADYVWIRRNVTTPIIDIDAAAERLIIEGFALDSAVASVQHRGDRHGTGRAMLAAWQDDHTDYRADMEFTLALDRSELLVHDLALRFDTIHWQSTRPGRIAWHGEGVEVDSFELASDQGGLVFLDGRLPIDGEADLHVILREVELAHLGLILQDEADLTGRVSLEAQLEGTLRDPVFEGVGILAGAARNGQEIPDARIVFAYENTELTVQAELFEEEGRAFAIAEASLPIDLGIIGQEVPRLLDQPLAVDVRADSLPLGGLPAFIDELSNVEGVAAGQFSVRGTWTAPEAEGEVTIDKARFRVDPTGVRFEDVAGSLRLVGSELVVDSLIGRSGGPVRVTGTIDVSTLAEPGFDLTITAENAWAIRTDDFQVRGDADLQVTGPFDRVLITGEARTRRGVIYIPETRDKALVRLDHPELLATVEGRLLALAEELIETPSPLLANIEVEVDLHLEPDTWVRSTDYNIEIYTPVELGPLRVRLDQAAGRLTLEGTVNSDRGHYSFMGRRFVVRRGAATFVGGSEPDPIIQVTAEHEVEMPGREAFSIRVVLGGTLLSPTLAVESDARPPIAETDIFTYIALGRSAGALLQHQGSALSGQGTPSGELAGNAAGLATMQMTALAANTMLDEFESGMARELGLDVLHIAPADLPAELFSGRFTDLFRGTEVEIGRYIGPRLFAAFRSRLTTETRPGATVEYSTPAGFRWTTSYEPRFLPPQPTLREVDPESTSVFGAFMFKEWRF